jgi:FtsP/CotA-like multicopper oxidase with cupredoxin domain
MRRQLVLLLSALVLHSTGCSSGTADAPETPPPPVVPPAPLDAATIPKFVTPLVVPPTMPTATAPEPTPGYTYYEVEAVQFSQQILPAAYPATTVWGYGKVGEAATRHSPAFTFEVRTDEVVRVKWVNGLVDASGGYLPHLFPVDDTLHWANPSGAMEMTGLPYLGPVPIAVHVHGAHVADHSDGNPDDWFLPAANDLPPGYAAHGPFVPTTTPPALPAAGPGHQVQEYPNDQPATTLWYHDHALGITRLNVMAGLAGFWLVRDATEDSLGLPAGPQEIPLAIQDRSFFDDGSFRYPKSRSEFDGFEGPYLPTPDATAPPIWNPEFFGDSIMVNGRTWPYHVVEARLHRLRLLNGCNARFLRLRLSAGGVGWLPFQQIGSDTGLLPAPVSTQELLLGPGERADVLVDFSTLAANSKVTMVNVGPDEPYKGPSTWLPPANPETTGLVMEFRVAAATGTTTPSLGLLPAIVRPVLTGLPERELTLNELMDMAADVPVAAEMGTAADGALAYGEAATETPTLGATEIWRVVNLTADAHPIHLHLVRFQVIDRAPIDVESYAAWQEAHLALPGVWPAPDVADFLVDGAFGGWGDRVAPNERGWKDTVIAVPGEVTRLVATFDLAGQYVWHCHILEHEDNEMMRPLVVLP